MNCAKIQSLLSAYADRELSGVEMFLVRQHVFDCDACRTEEAEVRRVKSILASVEVAEPPPGFEARLLRTVSRMNPEPAAMMRFRSAGGFALTSLAAAAGICILYTVRGGPSAPAHKIARTGGALSVSQPAGSSLAVSMQRDSAFINSADPLSGPPGAVAASYAAP